VLGFWACRTKFDEYKPLFIGLLGPTRRGCGVLHFLSINRTLIRLRLKVFWKGLTRVKTETLSGSGRISRVRSGYGLGNQVMTFFLSVAIGLAELSSGRQNLISGLFQPYPLTRIELAGSG
jgi:hypothetical protein